MPKHKKPSTGGPPRKCPFCKQIFRKAIIGHHTKQCKARTSARAEFKAIKAANESFIPCQ
jgi:hypothetical protein